MRLFPLIQFFATITITCFAQNDFTGNCDIDYKIETAGLKLLANCPIQNNYNCHGFVISYLEFGCNDLSWHQTTVLEDGYSCPMGFGADNLSAASQYKESGKYIKVVNILKYKII